AFQRSCSADRRLGRAARLAHHGGAPAIRGTGWAGELWPGHLRFGPAGRHLCWPHSQRGKASRLAGYSADPFCAAGEPQDCKGAGIVDSGTVPAARRRGDRIAAPFAALNMSASLIGRLGSSAFRLSTNSSVDVAHGLSLLFGLGTKALPSWDSKTRWNNLSVDLAVNVTADSSGHTNSPHPSSREGRHSTVGWSSISSYCIWSRTGLKPLRLP